MSTFFAEEEPYKPLKGPCKWHGGKAYLANKITALMPKHLHYVEPYAGGLSVLLAKSPQGISEVVNDKNKRLTNFWQVLQSPFESKEFIERCNHTPFSEHEFERAQLLLARENSPLGNGGRALQAWAFFIFCRQSLAGRMTSFTGVTKTRTRRGMNNEVSAWLSAVEGLPAVHARLKRVLILNRDALAVIKGQDGPQTLFYADPPYLHSTRATTTEYGPHEMTEEQHKELLITLNQVQGKFMLSGYHSPMYDEWAEQSNFTCHEFQIPNNAAGGKTKRRMTECVFCNF